MLWRLGVAARLIVSDYGAQLLLGAAASVRPRGRRRATRSESRQSGPGDRRSCGPARPDT